MSAQLPFIVLNQQHVRELLTMRMAIELMREAMVTVLDERARQPLRSLLVIPGREAVSDGLGIMQGFLPEPERFGAKVLTVFPHNFEQGRPSHQGVVLMFDTTTGAPTGLVNAHEVTAIRTAAASALATEQLARPDARVLAVLGYGEQAEQHLRSMAEVRVLSEARVWGRSAERCAAFVRRVQASLPFSLRAAASVAEAVRGADIVCTTTAAREPVLFGHQLEAGMHVNLVGSSRASEREADDELVARARWYVDLKLSTMAQAGEFRSAMQAGLVGEDHIVGQIGELLARRVPGRGSADEITVYKSLGINAQDLATAHALLNLARERGVGHHVTI